MEGGGWLQDGLDIFNRMLPVIATVTGIMGGWLGASRGLNARYRNDMAEPAFRAECAEALRPHRWGELYERMLGGSLDRADRLFGPTRSWTSLGVCIVVSLIYTFLGFFAT